MPRAPPKPYSIDPVRGDINSAETGTVNMRRYIDWLESNGYKLDRLVIR